MRRTLALVLGGSTLAAAAMPPADVYRAVAPSVFRVATYDADGLPLAQGSAVVIAASTLVTNCHVLAKSRRVVVRKENLSHDAKLEMWDTERDLCRLRVEGLAAPAVAIAPTERANVGENVYAIGNPRGLDLTMSAGLISALRRNASGHVVVVQTSAAVSSGSSGGGLFNERAELVGLTTVASIGADVQNINFAIPADWIVELPARHQRLLAGQSDRPAPAATAARATGTTVMPQTASPPPAPTATTTVATATPQTAPSSRAKPAAAEPAYARIDEVDKLPFANDVMRDRYRRFLSLPLPRAFVVSDGGTSRQAWAAGEATPAERALQECRQSLAGRCFVYAIDDRVVYAPPEARR